MKILVPIDGSAHSVEALKYLVGHLRWFQGSPQVDLVHVQPPPPTRLPHLALSAKQLEDYYREEGNAALALARRILDDAGIGHSEHLLVGSPAEAIVEQSRRSGSDLILMATRGLGSHGSPILGSTAVKVLHLSSDAPVLAVNTALSY